MDIAIFAVSLGLLGTSLWAGATFIQGGVLSKVMGATCFLAAAVCLYTVGRSGIYLWRKYRGGSGNVVQNPLAAANAATAQAVRNAQALRAGFAGANARAVNAGNAARFAAFPNAGNALQVAVPNRIPPQ
jgi:hypothetical protein